MRIQLVTPAPGRSLHGNRITAVRWARILRQLGHRVDVRQRHERRPRSPGPDLLIALHARRSYDSIVGFRRDHPERPLVVALTGTDLYQDLATSADARRALRWADRLVLLQPEGLRELDPELRPRARVIYQSARPTSAAVTRRVRTFDVCVVGHLRPVKDPFRAALAARRLPAASRVRVLHAGMAMSRAMSARAEREMAENPRYRWLGERPRWQVRRLLAQSRAMVLSSLLEGGANVVSEALVAHLPVLASRVPGSIGMLGEDHPGYFGVRRTGELAALIERCERDASFLARLERRSRELAPRFAPKREAEAWRRLLAEVTG